MTEERYILSELDHLNDKYTTHASTKLNRIDLSQGVWLTGDLSNQNAEYAV